MSELFIGLISGTSMDGVDAALVDFGAGTPDLRLARSEPFPDALLSELRSLAEAGSRCTPDRLAAADAALGECLARAAWNLLEAAGVESSEIAAIGSHGQTVAHDPAARPHGYTLQVGDPNRIAERTGITTVADFRRRDVAAGGEGAPLMSGFHAAFMRTERDDTAVLNVGGIANLTLLPADADRAVSGFDTGPGNCLLDGWARRHLDTAFDADGAWAGSGTPDRELLASLLDDPYFRAEPPKSTGTQYFNERWLDARLKDRNHRPEDVAATLVALTAETVRRDLARAEFEPGRLMVCGGGCHNATMIRALADALPGASVDTTAAAGVDPDWLEAAGFAWLARETLAGRPGNLHTVTGAAGPRILGAIHPGN